MSTSKTAPTPTTTQASGSGRRKSRLLSIAATGGLIIMVGSCCLCGGVAYTQWPEFDSDPEAAALMAKEILPVTVPENFSPTGTIRWDIWMFLSMRGAYFTLANGDGELSFLEVDSEFIANDHFRQHVRQSLREHGAGGGFHLAIKQEREQTYDVAGQPVTFRFFEAENQTTGTGCRLVDGIVEGHNGPVMISLWVDEENWDPAQVDELIHSIGSE